MFSVNDILRHKQVKSHKRKIISISFDKGEFIYLTIPLDHSTPPMTFNATDISKYYENDTILEEP